MPLEEVQAGAEVEQMVEEEDEFEEVDGASPAMKKLKQMEEEYEAGNGSGNEDFDPELTQM